MEVVPRVDVVGVGLNATDTLIYVPGFPERGSKTEYAAERVMPGGQVASAVMACQNWGLRARYVGKLGNDDASRLHLSEFSRAGVEARVGSVRDAASARSLILVDQDGERTILYRRDDRMTLRPEELRREWIVNARALLVDGYDTAAAVQAARWAREAGVSVVADLDEVYPGVEALLERVDYLIVSRDLPTRLTGEPDLRLALQMVQRRYGSLLAAATLGVHGVLAWDGREFHHRPAYRVRVVDTTGAGDIFHAGFIYGLLQGWELDRQLDFACAAAGLNCTADGARGGIRRTEEILEFMADEARYAESREQVI